MTTTAPKDERPEAEFCCPMRARFVVAVVSEDKQKPMPEKFPDHVLHWGHAETKQPIVIGISFCPFCGKALDITRQAHRVVTKHGIRIFEGTGLYATLPDGERNREIDAEGRSAAHRRALNAFQLLGQKPTGASLRKGAHETAAYEVLSQPELFGEEYVKRVKRALTRLEASRAGKKRPPKVD